MSTSDCLSAPQRVWRWRLLAGLLILISAGLHLAYLFCNCPLDLAPDEAHYWDWSRHLDWSYYSKGPLIAYLIRGGYALAGPLAEQLTGSAMPAVRLPAVLCGALFLISIYILTVQVFGRERLAALVVALGLTLPLTLAGSSIMTIDSPFTACWGWALVLGHRAIFRGSGWAWPATGLLIGIGILAKYTMVLWLLSVGLFLLTSPAQRRLLFRPGFWIMCGVAAVCCLPILIWNAKHQWVTVRHVNGLAGVEGAPGVSWLGPLVYLGSQCGLLLIFWFIAWARAMFAHRPTVESDPGVRYLWWLSAPTFLVFLLFTPKTGGGEINWPVTAYISGLVLTGPWLVRELQSPHRWYVRVSVACLVAVCVGGLGVGLLMHYSERAYPLMNQIVGPPRPEQPFPLRRLDPTCRLRGWRTLAAEVDHVRDSLRNEGIEPLLAGSGWALPGELAFYCAGHPTVYSLGLALGDRRSQYDFWRPNPIWDPEEFHGRTFILVGGPTPELKAAFERVDPERVVIHHEAGEPISAWSVTVCRGFRGFQPVAELLQGRRY